MKWTSKKVSFKPYFCCQTRRLFLKSIKTVFWKAKTVHVTLCRSNPLKVPCIIEWLLRHRRTKFDFLCSTNNHSDQRLRERQVDFGPLTQFSSTFFHSQHPLRLKKLGSTLNWLKISICGTLGLLINTKKRH